MSEHLHHAKSVNFLPAIQIEDMDKADKFSKKNLSRPSVCSTVSLVVPDKTANEIKRAEEMKAIKLQSLKLKFPEISQTEDIINDFSCALKKDILVHGRLFIGINGFYFHSSIIGFETKIFEPWQNVVELSKARLAHIIPNAIRVKTSESKFTFASFSFRNYPYELMVYAIKNFKEKTNLKAEQIKDIVKINILKSNKDDSGLSTPLNHSESSLYDCQNSGPEDNDNRDNSLSVKRNETVLNEKGRKSKFKIFRSMADLKDISSSQLVVEPKNENCLCTHLKTEIVSLLFPTNIDNIFTSLYDESTSIMFRIYQNQGIINYKIKSRFKNMDGSVTVDSSHVYTKGFMGKSANNRLIEVFPSTNKPNIHYQIIGKTTTEGVPYSDSFEVITNACLLSKSQNETIYRVTLEVKFIKSLWGTIKQIIEKQAIKTSTGIITECVKEMAKIYGEPVNLALKMGAIASKEIPEVAKKESETNEANAVETPLSYDRKSKWFKSLLNIIIIFIILFLIFIVIFQYFKIRRLKKGMETCNVGMFENQNRGI